MTTEKICFKCGAVYCRFIDTSQTHLIAELAHDHEEADTKLVALFHAAPISPGQSVMIRSPSGNVDILVLFLLHSDRLVDMYCLVDNGTGKNHKITDMSTTGLFVLECQALASINAFSGNDYISSFFRKEKSIFGKMLEAINNFWRLFRILEGEMNSLRN